MANIGPGFVKVMIDDTEVEIFLEKEIEEEELALMIGRFTSKKGKEVLIRAKFIRLLWVKDNPRFKGLRWLWVVRPPHL